jgi:hypothetical protein
MKRFSPFVAFIYLLLILVVIVLTILEEVISYLIKLYLKARRNFKFLMKDYK